MVADATPRPEEPAQISPTDCEKPMPAFSGGLFGGAQLVKAARVKRKFRRAYADDGTSRQIEGLEIMTTYRCLDGVCGVEMPTSTTKSTLRLTRPTVAMLKAAGVEEAPSVAASSGEVL